MICMFADAQFCTRDNIVQGHSLPACRRETYPAIQSPQALPNVSAIRSQMSPNTEDPHASILTADKFEQANVD
jgi:hypothetical protein